MSFERVAKSLYTNVLPADYTISMEQYHAFATYQLQCRKKAISVVHDLAWMYAQQPHPPGFYVGQEARARGERTCETCYKSPQRTFYAKVSIFHLGQEFTCNAKLSSWLSYYLDMVELALVQDTAGAVATNHARTDAVFSLRQAIICDGCKTTENALGMVKFAEKLKAEIDRQIATVDVSVPGIV
ncbi:hypothetical protein PENSPDRAFT_693683 [Peniophora sp. CONT]|nr:hypothetical protein PENSPDRAFT_693683 [Peniophora sp. CONT]